MKKPKAPKEHVYRNPASYSYSFIPERSLETQTIKSPKARVYHSGTLVMGDFSCR